MTRDMPCLSRETTHCQPDESGDPNSQGVRITFFFAFGLTRRRDTVSQMCGRFVASSPPDQIAAFFGAELAVESLGENFNVAPTHDVYGVVARHDGAPQLEAFHWGLIPSWAKDRKIASRMINARSETLAEKPAFKGLLKKKRLILPMNGFYEWRAAAPDGPVNAKGKPVKQPVFISRADGHLMAVAGLWTAWKDPSDPDGRWLHTATIITTGANDQMASIHDRMPVFVPADRWSDWLDPSNDDVESWNSLFVARNNGILRMFDVSAEVNSVRNNDKSLLTPAS
jgi:putative SOS response-associated peptidase YedK